MLRHLPLAPSQLGSTADDDSITHLQLYVCLPCALKSGLLQTLSSRFRVTTAAGVLLKIHHHLPILTAAYHYNWRRDEYICIWSPGTLRVRVVKLHLALHSGVVVPLAAALTHHSSLG